MVYAARRTLCDLIIVGFVLGAIGVLPDMDHWVALTMGWAKLRFAHSPMVFMAYAFIWGLAVLALTARQHLIEKLPKELGEIGVRWPGYVSSDRGLLAAQLATAQDPSGARLGWNFYEVYPLPQQTAHQPATVSYLVRSRE